MAEATTAWIHIHAPAPIESCIKHEDCPICKRKRYMLFRSYEWYDPIWFCLGCGNEWSGGELAMRGRGRYWKRDAIAAAKKRWRIEHPKAKRPE